MLRLVQSAVDDIIQVDGQFDGRGASNILTRCPSEDDKAAAAALLETDPVRYEKVASRLVAEPTGAMLDVAAIVGRLQEVRPAKRSAGHHGGFQLHRTTITRDLSVVANAVRQDTAKLVFAKCKYVVLLLHESTTISKSDPCYIGVMYCTADFQWGYSLVGQTDAAAAADGVALAKKVDQVLATNFSVAMSPTSTWLADRVRLFGSDRSRHLRRHDCSNTFILASHAGKRSDGFGCTQGYSCRKLAAIRKFAAISSRSKQKMVVCLFTG